MKHNLSPVENNQLNSDSLKIAILIIIGIALPLILIPIIKIVDFSEIIEELVKAGIVLFLILKFSTLKRKIGAGILLGFLFGLSENILYLNNVFQIGDFSIFWQRFLWTVPMHIITVLIILLPALRRKSLIVLGLGGAIVVHLVFNNFMV